MNRFTEVYETMLGLREQASCVSGVADAFAEGEICAQAYEKMRAAYGRICQRLQTGDEDEDLEMMVEAMETIQRELCRRMFEY